MAKAGSTIAGLMECFGTVVSVSLQHGVPLKVLCNKLSHTRFEPSGWTGNERIGYAKSVMDYIFDGWNCSSFPARNSPFSANPVAGLGQAEDLNPVRPTARNSFTTSAILRLASPAASS